MDILLLCFLFFGCYYKGNIFLSNIIINHSSYYYGVDKDGKYIPSKAKGVKVDLHPGDMLVYRGNFLEHWRDAFTGTDCGQVFLHYNNKATKGSEDNKFDKRAHLGLPAWFKK
jgi:hypothetical protein